MIQLNFCLYFIIVEENFSLFWNDIFVSIWKIKLLLLKSGDITLPTKVCLVKAMVFPVVMYGCESWTMKKAEHQRIDAFELWCWRRLLRVPWTTRRSKQSTLKEISPEYSLGGLMLKLKLQFFGHLMQRTDSFEKTLIGKDWRKEEKGMTEGEMVGSHHRHNEFEHALSMGSQRVRHNWATELNWTEPFKVVPTPHTYHILTWNLL